jgi:hypothetical protein
MTTVELVKKLLDAGANAEVVRICLEAIDEAVEDTKHPRKAARRLKVVAQRA